MSVLYPDTFDSETQFSGYDSLLGGDPSDLAVVLANNHRDVRVMIAGDVSKQKSMSELDAIAMNNSLFDGDTMNLLESNITVPGENWVMTGTGASAITVGERTTYNGWGGIKATCNGSALAVVLTSIPATAPLAALNAVSIADMDFISVVVDGSHLTGLATVASVTMTLTSNTGGFGLGNDSAALTLTNFRSKEWRIAISSITGSADLTAITGVKITVTGNATHPTNGDLLYLFAVRAYTTAYNPAVKLGIDTRRGAVGAPVTWDLAANNAGLATLIRGVGATSDPTSQDQVSRMFVNDLGDLAIASTGTRDTVDFIFRENATAGTYIRVRFRWYSASLAADIDYWSGGAFHSVATSTILSGGAWTAFTTGEQQMVLEARVVGSQVGIRVYASDRNEQIGAIAYDNGLPDYHAAIPVTTGRSGWGAILVDRDAFLTSFDSFSTSLASGVTLPRVFLSPIEAVAISTASAADTNNFNDFSVQGGTPLIQDTSKLVDPATFSWASTGPLISNSVFIRDSSEAYIDFDIWVPLEATTFPNVVLRSPNLTSTIGTPPLILQPNQWNHIHIELDDATQAILGVTCYIYLEAIDIGPLPYTFNVANMGIFTRNVAWSARVNPNFPFRYFRDMTNAVDGKLHFPRTERGTQLQIAFEALTAEAWASSFSAKVQYAPLGLPLYYRM